MIVHNSFMALIPARGGSKGVLRKNLQMINGKPLIAHTIIQAKQSVYINRIIVSTDDDEIAEIAQSFGAEVPFKRPKYLATDEAKGIDVTLHAINWFKKRGEQTDYVVELLPTSPLRLSSDIDNAVRLMFEKQADAIVSVCKSQKHPFWSNELPPDGCMKEFINRKALGKNRQELPLFYTLNGSIYLVKSEFLFKNKSYYGEKTFAYIMPTERSVDIDSHLDLKLAEIFFGKTSYD